MRGRRLSGIEWGGAGPPGRPGLDEQPLREGKIWHVYVLRCGDGSFYCGISNDVEKRCAQHAAGTGARYTRGRGPLKLLRSWPTEGLSAALRAELAFKKLGRIAKLAMIEGGSPRL
jgi:predicted GIY-YIG superfamily endonuclease